MIIQAKWRTLSQQFKMCKYALISLMNIHNTQHQIIKSPFFNFYADQSPVALWSWPAARNLQQDSHLFVCQTFFTPNTTKLFLSYAWIKIHIIFIYILTHRQGGSLLMSVAILLSLLQCAIAAVHCSNKGNCIPLPCWQKSQGRIGPHHYYCHLSYEWL